MATLLITVPGVGDLTHEIAGEALLIGRGDDCDIRVDDPSVANRHVLLTWNGKSHELANLDDDQRTFVNGSAVKEAELTSRSLLRLGDVEAIFFPGNFAWIASQDLRKQLAVAASELKSEQERHEKTHRELITLNEKFEAAQKLLHERAARLRALEEQGDQLRAGHEKMNEEVAAAHREVELLTKRWNNLVGGLQRVREAEVEVNHLIGSRTVAPLSDPSVAIEKLAVTDEKTHEEFSAGSDKFLSGLNNHVREVSIPESSEFLSPLLPQLEAPEASLQAASEAIRAANERLQANLRDRLPLHALFGSARALAQHADSPKEFRAVRCMASTLEALLGDFCKVPEQLDAPRAQTVNRGVETLRRLLARDQLSAARDLFRAKICVVSDDAEEPMIAALRLIDMDISALNYPTARMNALAEQDCDLIVLEPGVREAGWPESILWMRSFKLHHRTPILVLMPPPASRDQPLPSTMSGHEDFIIKPFNIFEMAVKILENIFRHRLDLADA